MSDIRLLGNLQGVVYFDSEIPRHALQLRVAQEKLDCSQVPGSSVDMAGSEPLAS